MTTSNQFFAVVDDVDEDDEPPTLVSVDPQSLPPSSCPVTILSGFLGSGKSTLVQYILKSPNHGKRIAVVENEFGAALQIESLIVRDGVNNNASLADLIELPNGCVCCTVKDSLVATLENLLNKRNDLDYILIECSGMANPGPVASLFWLDEALESRLRLDGIITLVDAVNIEKQLSETEEAAQQIAYADRILLNKVDLLKDKDSKQMLDRIVGTIRQIQPLAPVVLTTYSQVPDLNWVLDAHCFDKDRVVDIEKSIEADEAQQKKVVFSSETHQHPHHHHNGENSDHCSYCAVTGFDNHHHHTRTISSVFLQQSGSVDLDVMNKWLASLLWPNQDQAEKDLREKLEQAMIHGTLSEPASSLSTTETVQQIFRIKGVISVRHPVDHEAALGIACDVDATGNDRRRYIVQAVHDLWEIHPASVSLNWGDDEDRYCKLVVIGRFLVEGDLLRGFLSCFP